MKPSKLRYVLLALCLIFLAGCSEVEPYVEDTGAFLSPAEFYSFEDFESAILSARQDPACEYAQPGYAMDQITSYFLPAYFENTLNLDAICVKARYVCIYYYLEDLSGTAFASAEEAEAAVIANTVQLEWRRVDDAAAELASLREAMSLVKLSDSLYYSDVSLPTDPEHILARSYYWMQNGQVFDLMVPAALLEQVPENAAIESGTGLLELTEVPIAP